MNIEGYRDPTAEEADHSGQLACEDLQADSEPDWA